jgi:sporulation protein YlmC with PRC-barrel domain
MTGRVLHAKLHLLDRQLIDQSTGHLVGKVDDVELDLDADPPVVSALFSGSVRIPAQHVAEIDSAVKVDSRGLDLAAHDAWVEHRIIDKISGAGDATE